MIDETRIHAVNRVREILAAGRPQRSEPVDAEQAKRIPIRSERIRNVAAGDIYDFSVRIENARKPDASAEGLDCALDLPRKMQLKALVNDIVEISSSRQAPRTHASVWAALNRAMQVSRHSDILIKDFENATKVLKRIRAVYMHKPSSKPICH